MAGFQMRSLRTKLNGRNVFLTNKVKVMTQKWC